MSAGLHSGEVVLASGSSGSEGGVIAIVIVFIVMAAIAASIIAYFSLQKHRSDAVAHAEYRKLAEEAVSMQDQVLVELKSLGQRIGEIEHLLRSVE